MNTKGIDVKERIRAVIDGWCREMEIDYRLLELRAILADIEDAERMHENTHFTECVDCTRKHEKWCSYFESKKTCDYKQYLQNKREPFIPAPSKREDVPKPTPEQLKAIGKVLDGDAPRACSHLDIIWNGNYPVCGAEDVIGELRWHLKDVPKPEPVKRCATCGRVPCRVVCQNFDMWIPKEPESAPGLVSWPIKEKYGHWRVCYSGGITQPIDEAFCQIIFHHIELKSGATVTTLQAFAENDPPVRAWFRETT